MPLLTLISLAYLGSSHLSQPKALQKHMTSLAYYYPEEKKKCETVIGELISLVAHGNKVEVLGVQ